MTFFDAAIPGRLSLLWARLHGRSSTQKLVSGEPPLRSELLSASQMEEHGKSLATAHTLSSGHTPEQLLGRLGDNEDVLGEVRSLLADAVEGNRRITPAGEWLLDNFYLIE